MKRTLFVFFIVLTAVIAWMIFPNYEKPRGKVRYDIAPAPLSMGGINLKNYVKGQLVGRIQVDHFMVKARRFGIFRLKSVNEAIFLNTKIDSYPAKKTKEAAKQEEGSFFTTLGESVQSVAKLRGVGRLTRTVFSPFEMSLHHDKQATLLIRAETAQGDMINKEFSLFECQFFMGDRRLKTSKANWNQDRKTFYLPGKFSYWQGPVRISGGNAELDLSMNLRVLGKVDTVQERAESKVRMKF